MRRYLVFGGADYYYPSGGWKDWVGSFDDLAAAMRAAGKEGTPQSWRHVVDAQTGEIVEEFYFDHSGKRIVSAAE